MLTNHQYVTRGKGFSKSKPSLKGITGKKDEGPELSKLQGNKLFSTIVNNNAGICAKLKLNPKFINMKTRGKAVAIGPLEYCGNGIPLSSTQGTVL